MTWINVNPQTPMLSTEPEPHFNMKTVFSRYRDSHYKDKPIIRPSCVYIGNSCTYTEMVSRSSTATILSIGTWLWCLYQGIRAKEMALQQWHHVSFPLTHLPLDKMAGSLADDNFKYIFMNENDRIRIRISLKFVPRSPIDNKPTLVQIMAWHQRSDKPLPELMLT